MEEEEEVRGGKIEEEEKRGWKEKKKQGGKSQKRDDRSESLPSFLSLCGVQPLLSLHLILTMLLLPLHFSLTPDHCQWLVGL